MKTCPLMLACLFGMVVMGSSRSTGFEDSEMEGASYESENGVAKEVSSEDEMAAELAGASYESENAVASEVSNDEEPTDENSQHTIHNHFYRLSDGNQAGVNAQLTSLQTTVTALKTTIENSPVKLSGCHRTDVGYAYKQHNEQRNGANTGELNHLSYNKKRDDTVLLITYANNIRTLGAGKAARWYVKVDGLECSVPSRVEMAMYQSSGDNTHVPGVLMGVCQATAAGHLSKGAHRISIHVGALHRFNVADAYTGWRSSSLLEVKEMCPSF